MLMDRLGGFYEEEELQWQESCDSFLKYIAAMLGIYHLFIWCEHFNLETEF